MSKGRVGFSLPMGFKIPSRQPQAEAKPAFDLVAMETPVAHGRYIFAVRQQKKRKCLSGGLPAAGRNAP